ncbi:MAG: hypothetical protein ABIO78_10080, partial [Thermoanaerobaculia bacterium]
QEKWLISTDGGLQPSWRGDGREIFYLSRSRKMMAVPISYQPQLEVGTAVALFDAALRPTVLGRQYDVTPDGQRFLLNRRAEEVAVLPLTLVQNWSERTEGR